MPRFATKTDAPRPFLKWAGGKGQLVPELLQRFPARYGAYHEPFLGGGALFFAAKPGRAVLSDRNPRLVRAWRGVQQQVERVIARLRTYEVSEDFFYALRKQDIDAAPDDAEVAAWMIYLNKTGYNGLYRVNSKGGFNVPWGRYANPNVCDAENLRRVSAALKGVRLEIQDFEAVEAAAVEGDFVYFDPPYVPLSKSSSFTAYTKDGFGPDDQARLRDLALRLKGRGVAVLLSNAAAPETRALYAEGFVVEEVLATRAINSVGSGRGRIAELVIR